MNFLLRSSTTCHLRRRRSCDNHLHIRTLYDAVSTLKCPRDRGFDHAVERDKHLKPIINLKNVIISEPSKSIPLSLITQTRETLGIPFRPIDFIRKYPSIFQEFFPGSLNIHPHIKLSPEIISLSSEEDLLYQSVNYKQDIAGRLLKLLMIGRINKIPIFLLESLKWELGLPHDYEKAVIPEFPDYFRVISGKNLGENEKVLELVCWSDEFAVSEVEKKGAKAGKIEFSFQFSKEFEMDKKYKKWLNEWQKLPYVSPYENAMHLASKTDESDKWSVAVLHELLSLFVGKRVDRESLLYLGEYLGLRSRFKRAFLQHPGIFYVSSKIGTHTVVLKEAYKRGMLIEGHPLMDMRSKYIKLMNVEKDEEKAKTTKKKTGIDVKKSKGEELEGVEGEEGEEEGNGETYDSSDDDENDEHMEEDSEGEDVAKRGRLERKGQHFEERNTRRNVTRRSSGRGNVEYVSKGSSRGSRTSETYDSSDDDESDEQMEVSEGEDVGKRGRFQRKGPDFDERNTGRSVTRRTSGRGNVEYVSKSSSRFSRRTNDQGGDSNIPRRNATKSDFSRYRTHGRGTEETNSRFSRRTDQGGDSNTPRRTTMGSDFSRNNRNHGRGSDETNSSRFSRTDVRGGDSNTPRRTTMNSDFSRNRTNRRGTEDNVSQNSSRFSRRSDVERSDSYIPRRTGRKSDSYGNGARSKTGKTPYSRNSAT